jgi:hypothetical protein
MQLEKNLLIFETFLRRENPSKARLHRVTAPATLKCGPPGYA